MTEHVTEWLSAYMDGELRGSRLRQVEEHLTVCQECRAELESLQSLSNLLHEVPQPEFTSPERLASQVNLQLPRRLPRNTKRKAQEVGWWMIPVSLLAVWIFMATFGAVGEVVTTASEWGLLDTAPAWLLRGSSTGAVWSGTLGDLGLLSGEGLAWAATTERFTRSTLPQVIWQVSIALLYLGWIAIWWVRRGRQGHGQPLES